MVDQCTPFITCDNKDLTWEALVKLLVGVTDNGCPALRVLSSVQANYLINGRFRPGASGWESQNVDFSGYNALMDPDGGVAYMRQEVAQATPGIHFLLIFDVLEYSGPGNVQISIGVDQEGGKGALPDIASHEINTVGHYEFEIVADNGGLYFMIVAAGTMKIRFDNMRLIDLP